MNISHRLEYLERKVWRMEKLIWYLAGIVSLKFGSELLPIAVAVLGG